MQVAFVNHDRTFFCEMSARPSGKTCGSNFDVRQVEYDQFGVVYMRGACAECRSKMLTGKPTRPLGWASE